MVALVSLVLASPWATGGCSSPSTAPPITSVHGAREPQRPATQPATAPAPEEEALQGPRPRTVQEYLASIPLPYRRRMTTFLEQPRCFHLQKKVVCVDVDNGSKFMMVGAPRRLVFCPTEFQSTTSSSAGTSKAGAAFALPGQHDKKKRRYQYRQDRALELTCGARSYRLEALGITRSRSLIRRAAGEFPGKSRWVEDILRRPKGQIIYIEQSWYAGGHSVMRLAMGRPPVLRWQTIVGSGFFLDGGSRSFELKGKRELFIPTDTQTCHVADVQKFRASLKKPSQDPHRPLTRRDLRASGFKCVGSGEPITFKDGPRKKKEKLRRLTVAQYRKLKIRKPKLPPPNKPWRTPCEVLGW